MKTTFTISMLLSSLLAVTFVSPLTAQKIPLPARTDAAALPTPQPATDRTTADVREVLSHTINYALTEGKFTALADQLAKPARDHLVDGQKLPSMTALNKIVAQFRTDFRDKYHQDLAFQPDLLNQFPVNEGPNDHTVTVSLFEPTKMPTAIPNGPTIILVNETAPGAKTEGALWRVNVPAEVTTQQLQENLTRHLQKLDDQKSTWSADPNVTLRAAATQVFEALTDSSVASEE